MEEKELYKNTKILIVDDESAIRQTLNASLTDEGFVVQTADSGEHGLIMMSDFRPHIVLLDIWMQGMDGIDTLQAAKVKFPDMHFVMMSGHGTIETAVKATRMGAWDFIEKPLSMDKILIAVNHILSYEQEKEEKNALLNKLRKNIAIIGESQVIMNIKQIISRVSPTHSWLLIEGTPGAGKNLVAQNIHYMSPRASKAFVDVNCFATPEDLLEAEFFGIEKGAWPGVDKTRKGKIELAAGGTFYIREVQDMNLAVQSKLLKFMQDKSFTRVGGQDKIEVDVRVIAASSVPLEPLIRTGKFREDLYHRLNITPIQIPDLHLHAEDIPMLITHFSDQVAKENGVLRKGFSEQALKAMSLHRWPGNVREIKNFIERIYILTPGEFVDVHDLKFAGLLTNADGQSGDGEFATFRDARAQFEKEYLIKKIQEYGGNISKTAEAIGLERSYLHRKIKSYGIDTKD